MHSAGLMGAAGVPTYMRNYVMKCGKPGDSACFTALFIFIKEYYIYKMNTKTCKNLYISVYYAESTCKKCLFFLGV